MSNIDPMMSFGPAQIVSVMALMLVALSGVTCQELVFKEGLQNDGLANWTATGRLRLTKNDMIVFEPLVNVLTVKEVCSINLRSCATHGKAPHTSEACFCTQETDEDYDLYVSSPGPLAGKDFSVRATVPSRYMFNPLTLSETIGDIHEADQGESGAVSPSRVKELEESLEAERQTVRSLENSLEEANDMKKQMANLMHIISKLVNDNKEMKKKLTSQMDIAYTKIDAIHTTVADNAKIVSDTVKIVYDLQITASDTNKKVNDLQTTASVTNKKVNDLQTTASDTNKRVHDLQITASNTNKKVNDLQTTVSDVNKKANDLQTTVSDVNKKVNALQTTASDVNKKVNALQTTASDVNKKVNALQTTASDVNKKVNALQTTASDVNKKVNGLQTTASDVNKKANDLQTTASNVNKKVNDLQTTSSDVNKKVNALQTTASDVSKRVNAIYTPITDNTKKMDAIYTSVVPPCSDVKSSDPRPIVTLGNGMEVMCDTVTDNGEWVVFQRRVSADVDFFRNWTDYQNGFGEQSGNFWLGLDNIHWLTKNNKYELRVDIVYKGKPYYANYNSFKVLGEIQNYKLLVSGYSGTAGDSLIAWHNGFQFSTYDRDHDAYAGNCSQMYQGAWWYKSCHYSNLNGRWNSKKYGQGVIWRTKSGASDSVSFSEMKMRALRT